MKFTGFGLASGVIGMVWATIDSPHVLTEANAVERLTISGLLLVAVVALYRELKNERKKNEEQIAELKNFTAAQTMATQQATTVHAEALGKMTGALKDQQRTLAAQVETYNKHIERIVDAATAHRRG